MVMSVCPVLDQKYPFWGNLVEKTVFKMKVGTNR